MSDKSQPSVNQTDRQLLRLAMEDFVFDAWKVFAEDRKMEAKAALEFLLWEYLSTEVSNQTVKYEKGKFTYRMLYTNAGKSKPRSVWLGTGVYKNVQEYADNFPASVNRVVYSALIHGLKKYDYLLIE